MISIPGRIPIHISPFFWFLILMIGWLNSSAFLGTAIWGVVIFASVLLHEYGHALTAIMFGQTAEIHLIALGGQTLRSGPKLSKWKEFFIVLNGPLAGILTFICAYFLLRSIQGENPILNYALEVAINVNLFWTLLNLLPVLPLDGGQLLRILLEGVFGLRGLKASLFVSIVISGLIGLYFFLTGNILMGALFFMLGFESFRGFEEVRKMAPEDGDQQLKNLIQEGLDDMKAGHPKEALEKFVHVRRQAPKGMLYVAATQYGARVLAQSGQYKQAYDWLFPLKSRLSIDYLHLLQQIAYRVQEWEDAVKVGEEAYKIEPSIDVALINAYSYAIMGKATPAVGWLRCADQLGLGSIQEIIERREFDAVRQTPSFQSWLKKRVS